MYAYEIKIHTFYDILLPYINILYNYALHKYYVITIHYINKYIWYNCSIFITELMNK